MWSWEAGLACPAALIVNISRYDVIYRAFAVLENIGIADLCFVSRSPMLTGPFAYTPGLKWVGAEKHNPTGDESAYGLRATRGNDGPDLGKALYPNTTGTEYQRACLPLDLATSPS